METLKRQRENIYIEREREKDEPENQCWRSLWLKAYLMKNTKKMSNPLPCLMPFELTNWCLFLLPTSFVWNFDIAVAAEFLVIHGFFKIGFGIESATLPS
jgi:hypothetical protein